MATRNVRGQFRKVKSASRKKTKASESVIIDHTYNGHLVCEGTDCCVDDCLSDLHLKLPKSVNRSGWRVGRRIIELGVLLDNLAYCQKCRLGPVPLTSYSVVGELRKGLSGYLYVRCQNVDCMHVNRVTYGKTHRVSKRGMPCFSANTKLGVGKLHIR